MRPPSKPELFSLAACFTSLYFGGSPLICFVILLGMAINRLLKAMDRAPRPSSARPVRLPEAKVKRTRTPNAFVHKRNVIEEAKRKRRLRIAEINRLGLRDDARDQAIREVEDDFESEIQGNL